MTKAKSLTIQHGGSHYVSRGIQPVEFWAANMWDAFSATILKYLTRWRQKGGVLDLEKAMHFAQFRIDLDAAPPYPCFVEVGRIIPMRDYVKANGIPAEEEAIFYALELWVHAGRTSEQRRAAKHFMRLLANFIKAEKEGLSGDDLFG